MNSNWLLVASWQVGSGRVAVYTGEADGKYTGPIAGWSQLGEMTTSLARWTAGRNLPLPGNMLIRQRVSHGQYRIELDLDPAREVMDLAKLPVVSVLSGKPGQRPLASTLKMRWVSPDTLAADVPLGSDQTALATLDLGGLGVHNLAPVCLPYSPEFEPARADQGQVMLQRIARATDGRERVDLPGIWKDLSRQPRWLPVAQWVLLLCVVLLLMEVLERRSGMLSMSLASMTGMVTRRQPKEAGEDQPDEQAPRKSWLGWLGRRKGEDRTESVTKTGSDSTERPSSKETPTPPVSGGMSEAMKQARSRMGGRMKRKD